MAEFFAANADLIVFLHVMSAVVWVGGMVAVRFAVHPVMQTIEEGKVRLSRSLQIMKNLYFIVLPFIVILLLTAIVMLVGLNLKEANPELYQVTFIKEGIWIVMMLNYAWMVARRNKAERYFVSGDIEGAKMMVKPIPHWMLPLNIFLGVVAIYLGVTLRGF